MFGNGFSSIDLRFGLRKRSRNRGFFACFSKTSILLKSLFFLSKIDIFQVSSLQKSNKNPRRNAFEKNIAKRRLKGRFWRPFWPPKASQIALKSDVKRSLFRDAMETARKSSQTIGTVVWKPSKWLCI